MKNFAAFNEAMKDAEMRQEFAKFLSEQKPETKDALSQTLIAFAAGKGFEITEEDLWLNCVAIKELTPEELDQVSGGSIFDTIWNAWKKGYNEVKEILTENDITDLAKEFWDATFGK